MARRVDVLEPSVFFQPSVFLAAIARAEMEGRFEAMTGIVESAGRRPGGGRGARRRRNATRWCLMRGSGADRESTVFELDTPHA